MPVEVTFRTGQLRKCYEEQQEAQRAWGQAAARKYVQRINEFLAAPTVQDVRNLRSLRLHKLTGDREGRYSIVLHDRWRLEVTFEEGPPVRVRVEEVTQHYGD